MRKDEAGGKKTDMAEQGLFAQTLAEKESLPPVEDTQFAKSTKMLLGFAGSKLEREKPSLN